MKSVKCPQCGLDNWETAEWCKGCKSILKSKSIISPNSSINSYDPKSDSKFESSSRQSKSSYQDFQTKDGNASQNNDTDSNRTAFGNTAFDAKSSFLAKNIERCNRNLMIVCVLVIVAVLGAGFLNSRYLSNVFLGAFPIERDQLSYGDNLPDSFRNYIRVSADDVFDTGATYVEVSKGNVETVKSKYLLLQIEGKLLLTEVDSASTILDGAKDVSLDGEIVNTPPNINREILEPLLREQPEIRSDLLPFMLNAKNDFYFWAYVGLAIGFVLLLIAGFYLWKVLKRMGNPENSPLLKSLTQYGSPTQVAAAIDAEIAGKHEKIGPVYISPSWIIQNSTFSMDVQFIEDIVWAYKKVTKHSVNLIPTGKTYEVVLNNSQGQVLSLNGRFLNNKKTDQILEKIYERIPWVVSGFDQDLNTFWNSDKATFIETVKARRNSYIEDPKREEPNVKP